MRVRFYKFAKKLNSTAQPTISTEQVGYEGQLKEGSSVINAIISINIGATVNPSGYNYAYIEDYNRYYFVDDWTWSEGLWTATLSVDVLASYKTEIGDLERYVLRAPNYSNGYVVDGFYPTNAKVTFEKLNFTWPITYEGTSVTVATYFNNNYKNGVFIIGVTGNNDSGITYYQMDSVDFRQFVEELLQYVPSDMNDVSNGIAKALYNPIQYISSVKWFTCDLDPNQTASIVGIKLGGYQMVNRQVKILNKNVVTFSTRVGVPKHPKSTHSYYLNNRPYTEYELIFNPFGIINLDTTRLIDLLSIYLDWSVDTRTGDAILNITSNNGDFIYQTNAKLFVDIPISQINSDLLGTITSVVSGVAGLVGGLASGNVARATVSALSGVKGAVESAAPTNTTKGAIGTMISYAEVPSINATFRDIVDTDPDEFGYPYCEVETLSVLGSGFIMCRDGDVPIAATETELTAISSYLTEGFFYE